MTPADKPILLNRSTATIYFDNETAPVPGVHQTTGRDEHLRWNNTLSSNDIMAMMSCLRRAGASRDGDPLALLVPTGMHLEFLDFPVIEFESLKDASDQTYGDVLLTNLLWTSPRYNTMNPNFHHENILAKHIRINPPGGTWELVAAQHQAIEAISPAVVQEELWKQFKAKGQVAGF